MKREWGDLRGTHRVMARNIATGDISYLSAPTSERHAEQLADAVRADYHTTQYEVTLEHLDN